MSLIPGAVQNSANMFGNYHQQTVYGQTYHVATAAAGVTLTTTGSTTQTFGLWNPAGNIWAFVPTLCRIGLVSGTTTPCSPTWTYSTGLGSTVAGTSPITARSALTPVNGNLYKGDNSSALAGSSFTLGAAPSILRYTGLSVGAVTATSSAVAPLLFDDFQGDVLVAPGTAIFLSASAAPGAPFNISLSWIEVPFQQT